MVDEPKIKKIINKRKKELKTDEFKKYLREVNRSFGTNFTEGEFI